MTIQSLDIRLRKIEQRNSRVEADKAWEGSVARKILIVISTYLTLALYFYFVLHVEPFLNAIVPTAGFLLSTFTFPFFKKLWILYAHKK